MTELILSEVVHGNAWKGKDVELARHHLLATSMMTSQKQLDMVVIQERDSQNKSNNTASNDDVQDKSVSSNKSSTAPTFKPNETLHLVFNDLNFLQEKIAEND